MIKKILLVTTACLTLVQCNTLRTDCEALAEREAEIAAEAPGDYYIGRRYYIPYTRFWGYLRKPGQSWRTAKLVIMDEQKCRQPDRGIEPPLDNPVFGTDHNVEYIVRGSYTGSKAYEPNSDSALDVFRATGYEVRNREPGFLFVPSEKYSVSGISLHPKLVPDTNTCQEALKQ